MEKKNATKKLLVALTVLSVYPSVFKWTCLC